MKLSNQLSDAQKFYAVCGNPEITPATRLSLTPRIRRLIWPFISAPLLKFHAVNAAKKRSAFLHFPKSGFEFFGAGGFLPLSLPITAQAD
jgi:hypothetical protein